MGDARLEMRAMLKMHQGGERMAQEGQRAAVEHGNIHRGWRRW